jgi:hypothetical protein
MNGMERCGRGGVLLLLPLLLALAGVVGVQTAATAAHQTDPPPTYPKPTQVTKCLNEYPSLGTAYTVDCYDEQAEVPDHCYYEYFRHEEPDGRSVTGHYEGFCPTDPERADPNKCWYEKVSSTGGISWWGPYDCPVWEGEEVEEPVAPPPPTRVKLIFPRVRALNSTTTNSVPVVARDGNSAVTPGVPLNICYAADGVENESCTRSTTDERGRAFVRIPSPQGRVYLSATVVSKSGYVGRQADKFYKLQGRVVVRRAYAGRFGVINANIRPTDYAEVHLQKRVGRRWVRVRSAIPHNPGRARFARVSAGRYRVQLPRGYDRTGDLSNVVRVVQRSRRP